MGASAEETGASTRTMDQIQRRTGPNNRESDLERDQKR